MIQMILGFVFVFGILVFVHEFGHYMAARILGVKVEEFAFGFPPRIWSKKKGETIYAINAVPIGGYVRLLGEEGEGDKKDKGNFLSKKPWQKSIILAAGVTMNLILAYLLLCAFYLFGGRAILPNMANHNNVIDTQKVVISEVVTGSPAAKEGLAKGDTVLKIDDKEVKASYEVFSLIQKKTKDNKEAVVMITIEKQGNISEKILKTYTYSEENSGKKTEYQRIGIAMDDFGKIQAKWYAAPGVAFVEMGHIIKLTLQSLGDFVKTLFTQFKLSENVGGPVTIFYVTGMAVNLGFSVLVQVVVMLSVTLAIINVMPFPALDGGHIFFLGLEKLLKREIPPKVKDTVNRVGFYLLLLLMAAVTFKDFGRYDIINKIREWFS